MELKTGQELRTTKPEDLAIRAPLPIFHFLRSSDVAYAVSTFPNSSQIPARNRARLRRMAEHGNLKPFELCLEPSTIPPLRKRV
mmetsp:Transcript_26002/g.35769  ORF Transcript_26002/g.35769 Transcript_26002/m.35769 type:complete len:84 (-) Transcript_26002:166-417(-)